MRETTPSLSPFVPWPQGEILVLASRSPRRADLLRTAGIPFEIRPADAAEADHAPAARALQGDPSAYAELLAGVKADAVARSAPERIVLGADTIVVLDGAILEKPNDEREAVAMLTRLAGRRHTVISAVALRRDADRRRWTGHASTEVEFLPLTAAAIHRYVETGEPMDKAGAYGIQGYGALMVRGVRGCYFNVMGLPLALLGEALRIFMGDDDGPA